MVDDATRAAMKALTPEEREPVAATDQLVGEDEIDKEELLNLSKFGETAMSFLAT